MTITSEPTMPSRPPFDESDLLRAAALIHNELRDLWGHCWKDLVELVRDMVDDGDRGAARALAWRALTEVLTGVPLRWTGEPGQRIVTLRPSEAVVLAVSCHHCGVPPGERCVRPSGRPARWPHEIRERDAVCPPSSEPWDPEALDV